MAIQQVEHNIHMIQKLLFLLIVELHAEVFYAECSLLEALLTFLQVSTIQIVLFCIGNHTHI